MPEETVKETVETVAPVPAITTTEIKNLDKKIPIAAITVSAAALVGLYLL